MKWQAQVTASTGVGARDSDPLRNKIEAWSRSLIDLGGRNRLLHFRETTTTLRIQEPPTQTLLAGLGRGWPFASLADDPDDDESEPRPRPADAGHGILTQKNTQQQLDRALRSLQTKTTQIFNDYGLWVLQLGVGMVVWRDEGATVDSRAPLLLFPVRIVKTEDGRRRLGFREDEEAKHNPALHVKLEQLELNWNAVRSIEPTPETVESIFEAAHRAVAQKPGWKIDSEQVALGLFTSHKEAMYQDLRDNADNVAASELIRTIGSTPGSALVSDRFDFEMVPQELIDVAQPPEDAPLVLDADGSQRQAVIAAMEGRSYVLDGPPGTGKSQTITNIIAALLYSGSTVLFVSEKAAALDVVLNRLNSVGLGSFVLALHSHNTTRKAVAHELGRALTEEPVAPPLSESDIRNAQQAREQLGAYASAMNDIRKPLGLSLHDAIGRTGLLGHAHDGRHLLPATFNIHTLAADTLEDISDLMSTVAAHWDTVTSADFAWSELQAQPIDGLNALRKAVAALRETQSDAARYSRLNCGNGPFEPSSMERLIAMLALVPARHAIPSSWLTMPEKQFGSEVTTPVDGFLHRLRGLGQKVDAAVDAVGERWQEMPERLQPYPSSAERELAKLQPVGVDLQPLTARHANKLASAFESIADELDSAYTDLTEVAETLGMPAIARFDHATSLCELVGFAALPNRPLADWLMPEGSRSVLGAAVHALADAIVDFTARRDRVVKARRLAARTAGPGWPNLPASLFTDQPVDEQGLEELSPAGLSLENLEYEEIVTIADRFGVAADRLEAAHRHGRSLAKLLQISIPDSTAAAEAIVGLVQSSTSTNRALAGWLVPETLERVRVAEQAIIAAEQELREAELAAREWFVPEVVHAAGFPDLVGRIDSSTGFFAALSKQTREDRRLVGTLSNGGSWQKDLKEKLPAALAWHRAHAAFRDSRESHSALLGRYVSGEQPDLQALTEAIRHAEEIHQIAATALADPNQHSLIAGQLCDQNSPTDKVLEHTAALDIALRGWRHDLVWHVLSPFAASLAQQSLVTAAEWLRAHDQPLRRAAHVMETVTRIGGAEHDPRTPPVLEDTRKALAHALQAQQLSSEFEAAAEADRRVLLAWYDGLETDTGTVGQGPADHTADADCAKLLRKAVASASARARDESADLRLLGRYGTELDTAALTQALHATRRIERLSGEALTAPGSRELLVAALADGQRSPADLLRRADRIQSVLKTWNHRLGQPELRPASAELRECTFEEAARWHRTHVPCLRDAADYIQDVVRVGGREEEPTLREARAAVESVVGARAARQRFEKNETEDRVLLGDLYAGGETDRDKVVSAMDWARKARRTNRGPLTEEAALELLMIPADPGVAERFRRWHTAAGDLQSCFDGERAQQLATAFDESFQAAGGELARLDADQNGPHLWNGHRDTLRLLAKHDLAELPASLGREGAPADLFRESTECALLSAWIEHHFSTDQRLEPHFALDRDRLVQRFQDADVQLATVAQSRVIESCNRRRPRGTAGGQTAIIKNEAEKKTRHMPVRRLLDEAAEVVQRIKPCFMMSPLTVSQFLPTDFRFDVVIFDEASQVLPQDAVNSIYRGDALIVAGDQKQLPPTSFFSIAEGSDDEWTEEGTDVFESILDECKASGGFRDLPLRWHYRSRHENLIAFSNHEFYDSGMVTFPGALEHGNDVGVEFFPVDGVYDRGGRRDNPIEAKHIAARVVHHFETRPLQSLGVVALSKNQADAISTAVERAIADRPELRDLVNDDDRLDGFFVKNLESVQGDERDVIILSIGYGPDDTGKLRSQFGPVNKEGGWRRLNVAITRARRRMEVVASFRGGQLPDSANRSVQALKRFLHYAEFGPRTLTIEDADPEALPESPFEEDVLNVLRGWGYRVQPQVGVAGYRIDMAVRHPNLPGMYAIGIECDGAMYHSSRVARDRDRLRQEVLENLGWTLHRIWGTDWYRNRKDAISRLREAVQQACENDPVPVPQTPAATAPPARKRVPTEVTVVPVQEAAPFGQPYVEVSGRELDSLRATVLRDTGWDGLDISSPEAVKAAVVLGAHIIERESPIEETRLVSRIRTGLGFERTKSRIQATINAALADLVRSRKVIKSEATYFWSGHELLKPRQPTHRVTRGVKDVPPVERRLVICRTIADNPGITWDETRKATGTFFGWSRLGPEIAQRLQGDLDHLIGTGEVEKSNSGGLRLRT